MKGLKKSTKKELKMKKQKNFYILFLKYMYKETRI